MMKGYLLLDKRRIVEVIVQETALRKRWRVIEGLPDNCSPLEVGEGNIIVEGTTLFWTETAARLWVLPSKL